MKKENKSTTRILYIETNEIGTLDIPRVLNESGYDVYHARFGTAACTYDEKMKRKIAGAIDIYQVQYVMTYDFIEVASQACLEMNVPYISWIYDAPQKELYTHFAFYPCNYFFEFDRKQKDRLQKIGIRNSFYMPLGVHANMIQMVLKLYQEKKKEQYQTDISFVGQLYHKEENDKILQKLKECGLGKSEEIIESCYMKWDEQTTIHERLDDETVSFLRDVDNDVVRQKYPYISEQYYYEAAFLARILAYKERTHILNVLAQKYQVKFYTHDINDKQLSDQVHVQPGVKTEELPYIYNTSKINLNITLHCIETGASQRIFDVMGAGGFLLSNYQEELAEMFVPGEEIVLFHNEQELMEAVDYYMEHEDERERIAKNGQKKVLEQHDLHLKLEQMLLQTKEKEAEREKTYLNMQADQLSKQINSLLKQKNETAYIELYQLLQNPLYETCIQKDPKFGTVREMLGCWRSERELGIESILDDVENLEEANLKYLQIKHGLWRIEQNLSADKCEEALNIMDSHTISKYFIVWIIYANLRDRVETCIKVSRLFRERSSKDAMEVLSYALFFFQNNSQLLLEQADLLLENSLWQDALATLKKIVNPDQNTREIIEELESALMNA